jgi:dihydroorotase
LGSQIKCNPAIKYEYDRRALWDALLDNRLDIIATDHAPHTWEEKQKPYHQAPSGIPLVQHALLMMLEHVKDGLISKERMVEKMCHAPAECFRLEERGYLREGYWADLVLIDPNAETLVSKENILYKCGWSPWEGKRFSHQIASTFVSGNLVYHQGEIIEGTTGKRLTFNPNW